MAKYALFPKNSWIRKLFRERRRGGSKVFIRYARWWRKCYSTGHRAKLISLTDYRERFNLEESRKIFDVKVELIDGPKFANGRPPNVRADDVIEITRPIVEVIKFKNAYALAASDFVIKDGLAIHPDRFDPARDVCHSERAGIINIYPASNSLYASTNTSKFFDKGIILMGQCAGNYAHFLTEILPKLLVVDQIEEYSNYPIIIDSWTSQNIKDAIKYFNSRNRKIYELTLEQPAFCKEMVVVTPTSYAPPEYRDFLTSGKLPIINHCDYTFSPAALNLVRDKARKLAKPADWIGRKLFIHRAPAGGHSNGRNAINSYNIEQLAIRNGFSLIEPGSLSFSEQVSAFLDADVVISQIGAATANIIFTKPGCKVICMSPYYDGAEYYYHSMMADALYHHLSYITGPQIASSGGHPLHRDYHIPIEDFAKAIEQLGDTPTGRTVSAAV